MSDAAEKKRCEATIFSGRCQSHQCPNKASKQFKGKHYCKTHYPPTIEARRKATSDKWDAEWKAKEKAQRDAENKRKQTEREARLGRELAALIQQFDCKYGAHQAGWSADGEDSQWGTVCAKARELLAKEQSNG